jgi:hypothetical protein
MSKLIQPLPCPFCQVLPVIESWHGGPLTRKLVSCRNELCHASPSVIGDTRKDAVLTWNDRSDKS